MFISPLICSFVMYIVTRLTRRVPLMDQECAYLSGAPGFTPGFEWGSCYSIFSFMCNVCRSLFDLLSFFVCPLYYVLRFTDYDYPFGIFKLFVRTVHYIQIYLINHDNIETLTV